MGDLQRNSSFKAPDDLAPLELLEERFDSMHGEWKNGGDHIFGQSSIVVDGECVSFPSSAGGRLESSRYGSSKTGPHFNDGIEEAQRNPHRQASLRHDPAPKPIKLRAVNKSERWVKIAFRQTANNKSKGTEVIYAKDVDVPESDMGVARSSSAAEVLVAAHGRRVRIKKQGTKKKSKKGRLTRNRSRQRRYGHVMSQTPDNDEYLLSLGMMVGLRVAVGRQENPSEKVELSVSDFYQVDKYIFPPSGGKGLMVTPAHYLGHTFKFKEYAPKIFKRIRGHFNIDKMRYMLSVAGNCEFLEFFSNAKSGEFFFYSHDENFMIKTMKKAETRFLRRILPHYYEHIRKHPNTLLVRFCGMYRVKMHHINRKVHFMVMHSVFDTPKEMHYIYDLKGSTVGRYKKEGQLVGKDLDLVDSGRKLHLGRQKEAFLKVIEEDVKFLAKMNIMDYSLLLGIHDKSKPLAATMSTRDYHNNYVNETVTADGKIATHRRISSTGVAKEISLSDDGEDESNLPLSKTSVSDIRRNSSKRMHRRQTSTKSTGSVGIIADDSSESESDSEEDEETDFQPSDREPEPQELPARIDATTFNSSPAALQTARTGSFSTYDDLAGGSTATWSGTNQPMSDTTQGLSRRKDLGIPSDLSGMGKFVRGREVYYMGIIDILQEYNMRKHAETAFKSNLLRQSRSDISCVDPDLYGARFLNFITEHTD